MATFDMKYVHAYRDRHGKQRHYFRRKGKNTPLPGEPGSPEFMEAYGAAVAETDPPPVKREPVLAKSFKELALLYYASPTFLKLSPSSRKNYRRVIERFCEVHGHRSVKQFRPEHLDTILGRMSDTPGAAIVLLKRVRGLLKYAKKLRWIEINPASEADTYKSKEIHTWTEEEIAQFEARWEIGTKQRLGFALHLFTGQRGSDVHRMTWRDTTADTIDVVQQKTGEKLTVALHPDLQAVLAAAPRNHVAILTTEYGQTFSVKGWGNFMSEAISKAGLPTRCKAHGLRKAAARRLAESDCTPHQIMSVTGHRSLAEVERYTRAANQKKLSRQAIAKQVGASRDGD